MNFKQQYDNLKNMSALEMLHSSGALFLVVLTIISIAGFIVVARSATRRGDMMQNTISVTATGETYATPDIAEFTFSVTKEDKEVSLAQTFVTKKMNDILAQLEKAGIDKKDITTTSLSANPKYEWHNGICRAGYCPEGKQVLTGYEASHTVSVRLHNLDKSGEILQLLGTADVTNLNGPNFTFEDPEQAKNAAREEAIAKARTKAKSMAKAMGVHLGKIVSFNEDGMGGGYPMPMYEALSSDMTVTSGAAMMKQATPVATIAVGDNQVSSTVTIIYKIR